MSCLRSYGGLPIHGCKLGMKDTHRMKDTQALFLMPGPGAVWGRTLVVNRSGAETLSIISFCAMPLEEVEQYQSDSGSGEVERQSDAMSCFHSDQSDAHGPSSDSDGDGSAM
jgi:hypothetical protein